MSMIIGIQPSGKATDFDSVISLVRIQVSQPIWRFSSVGRASALQAEGQRFEPVNLHHSIKHNKIFAGLAQLVEQLTCNQQVEGSSPLAGTSNGEVAKWLNAADCNSVPFGSVVRIRPSPPLQDPLAQSVEHLTFNQRVRRSSRLRVTILKMNSACPGGEIGRRTGLKILRTLKSVPVRLRPWAPFMRVQFNGRTSAFQADYVGSIPITRSIDLLEQLSWQSNRLLTDRSQVRVLLQAPCGLLEKRLTHMPFTHAFTGSNPVQVTIFNGGLAQLGEHLPYKQRVSGSSPLTSTIFYLCRLSSTGRATDL